MGRRWYKVWRFVLGWFIFSLLVFIILQEVPLVLFSLSFGLGFGALAWKFRRRVRPWFRGHRLGGFWPFILFAIVISMMEELWCWLLGGTLAHPVLLVDLIFVSFIWTAWFGTWYLFLSRKYKWREGEALLTASTTGILFEYLSTLYIFRAPLGVLIIAPLAIMVYAAIFVLPMQLMPFTGQRETRLKYAAAILLPYLAAIPLAIIAAILFSLVGVRV